LRVQSGLKILRRFEFMRDRGAVNALYYGMRGRNALRSHAEFEIVGLELAAKL
jgi:hypothetical protein